MTPMMIQIRATTAALPPDLRTPAAVTPPIVIAGINVAYARRH